MEHGEITPTHKLKRKVVIGHFAEASSRRGVRVALQDRRAPT
jgi:hypothetical protein